MAHASSLPEFFVFLYKFLFFRQSLMRSLVIQGAVVFLFCLYLGVQSFIAAKKMSFHIVQLLFMSPPAKAKSHGEYLNKDLR